MLATSLQHERAWCERPHAGRGWGRAQRPGVRTWAGSAWARVAQQRDGGYGERTAVSMALWVTVIRPVSAVCRTRAPYDVARSHGGGIPRACATRGTQVRV